MNASRLAVDLAGLADAVLAVDHLAHGGIGEVDFRQVHVDRVVNDLGVVAFADFGFMLEDDTAVIGPAIHVMQWVFRVAGFFGGFPEIDNCAVGDGPYR
ncbi:hypothetical protein AOX63_10910 [Pseudomonas sp. ADP]|uniref:Uncharacterized protein n=1 Tax=Pseudomonas citronellolis TaxID=53408 RepID=A0A1A9KIA7_9PSED|nr:hypothetical protein A9C11_26235 [Pseudomonas citronellolis]KRV76039.1 hypothetical protein AO742_13210 [Pseudomonas citronellolis]KRW79969.1 hypothetical protein AO738_16670 [Pseudomonas citronellolis]KSW24247.1 hypothetical protein AOX63_10910 [Pseudomonas sp. ADP]OBP13006.1 hypothetical protein BAE52_01260 [Pseudomonas sp. EGD-AKN5]